MSDSFQTRLAMFDQSQAKPRRKVGSDFLLQQKRFNRGAGAGGGGGARSQTKINNAE